MLKKKDKLLKPPKNWREIKKMFKGLDPVKPDKKCLLCDGKGWLPLFGHMKYPESYQQPCLPCPCIKGVEPDQREISIDFAREMSLSAYHRDKAVAILGVMK